MAVNESAISKANEADLLVETNSSILDMVRKDLSQEYLRLVARAMQESVHSKAGAGERPALLLNMGKQAL